MFQYKYVKCWKIGFYINFFYFFLIFLERLSINVFISLCLCPIALFNWLKQQNSTIILDTNIWLSLHFFLLFNVLVYDLPIKYILKFNKKGGLNRLFWCWENALYINISEYICFLINNFSIVKWLCCTKIKKNIPKRLKFKWQLGYEVGLTP